MSIQLNITKRHHYIPKFLIEGFVGEDGKLALFNKKTGRLDKLRKSPKQVFFEWHRNTFRINGKNTDIVEKNYQFGESKFSETYRKITNKQEQIELSTYDLFHLVYFISEIHWRVPNQDNEFLDYIKKMTPENSILKLKDKVTGENISQELFSKIMNEPLAIANSKIIRAMESIAGVEKNKLRENWKLYYVSQNNSQLNLLSDNPLIIRHENTSNILESELIFPLSKGKIIYHTNGKNLKEISAENRINVDVLTFVQSNKMVCGPNSKYLEDISEFAKFYDTGNRLRDLKESVFGIFQ